MTEQVRATCPYGDASSEPCFPEGTELVIPTEEDIRRRTYDVVRQAARDMSGCCEDRSIDFPLYIIQAYTTPACRFANFYPDKVMEYRSWGGTRAVRSTRLDPRSRAPVLTR
jgi:hypothetical protein